jgi:hypothetical protein
MPTCSRTIGGLALFGVAWVNRRQVGQIPFDRTCELVPSVIVGVAASVHDPQIALPPLSLPRAASFDPEMRSEARPLRRKHERSGESNQDERDDAHNTRIDATSSSWFGVVRPSARLASRFLGVAGG